MKTQNSFKRMLAVVFVLFALLVTASADWTTYDCSVSPEAYGFSAGSDATNFIGTADIVDDVDNTGNKLLDMRSAEGNRYYWKNSFGSDLTTDSAITVVFRMKAETVDSGKVAEFQVYNGSFYDKFYFTDGKVDSNKDGESSVSLADLVITDFNIYRITLKGDAFNVWINDVLVLSGITKGEKDDAPKFVFGDSSDSKSYAAIYDWIIWDVTGAYAPGEGSDYPAGYVISPLVEEVVGEGDWSIFSGDQTFADYGCSAGSSSKFGGDVNVVDDAENAGNKLVEIIGSDSLKNYWKFYLADSAALAEVGVTVITRMKAQNDTANVSLIQITNKVNSAKLWATEDGKLKVDGDQTYATGLDFSDFHVFRATMVGNILNVWVDDVKYCNNLTVVALDDNKQSLRIGDASTSTEYSSVIDWVIWDETGAYAPGEGSDYPSSLIISPLTGGEVVIPDFFYFDETTVAVSQEGEVVAAGLEANASWTLECDESWITSITPLAGDSGVATVSITAEANTGAAPRTATIYGLIGDDEMDVLLITQDGLAVEIEALGATASSLQLKDGVYKDAAYTIDKNNVSVWVAEGSIANGSSEWVKLAVAPGSEIVMVKITEYKNSQRLTCFSVDYWNGSAYVEILAQQLSQAQAADTTEMAFALPSAITTDTVKFNFYGNTDLSATDPTIAEGWLSISELSLWGGAAGSSIEKTGDFEYKVYPNPSTGSFMINDATGADVKVISLSGQVCYEKSNISSAEQINMNVPSGIYILKVGEAVSKIVIE